MFLSAWAVDGSKVPASMARRESFRASNENGGVTGADDLLVTALPVPGGAVRIMPGAATILNTYPGGARQAYGIANDAAVDLAVPATGSGSAATRYVIVRIDDPEFGGQEPADPLTAPYNYPTLVSSIDGLTYPFEVLAKITQPPSTATITQGLITDMRTIANPKIWIEPRGYNLLSDDLEQVNVTASQGELFPNAGQQTIYIPKWATSMTSTVRWEQVRYPGGDTAGRVWLEFGPYAAPSTRKYSTQQSSYSSGGNPNSYRGDWSSSDTVDIADDIRGTNQIFYPKAKRTVGNSGNTARMDGLSSISFYLTFRQLPVGDYTP